MNISPSDTLKKNLGEHSLVLEKLCWEKFPEEPFNSAVSILAIRVAAGGKILICGNGGSAADAQHLAAEFVIRYKKDREPIPAIALTTDSSVLTAAYNDGYEPFQRQVQALGRSNDVLIAISTSGMSQNIIEAIYAAQSRGMAVIGLTGMHGFRALQHPNNAVGIDVELRIPSDLTSVIQELHLVLYHALVEALERELNLCDESERDRPRLL